MSIALDHRQPAAAVPPAPRFDIYAPIHKALRLYMNDTVARIGRADAEDAADLQAALAQAQALLVLMRSHVQHENDFLHPAIEARGPGDSLRIAGEHAEHVAEIGALQDAIEDLQAAAPAARAPLAQRLYRQLALFAAENVQHMHVEETVHNEALWAAYSDDELRAIDRRIEAQLPPDEKVAWLRWIAASASPRDLATMLAGIRPSMPSEAFFELLGFVRAQLNAARWSRIARALGLPQSWQEAALAPSGDAPAGPDRETPRIAAT